MVSERRDCFGIEPTGLARRRCADTQLLTGGVPACVPAPRSRPCSRPCSSVPALALPALAASTPAAGPAQPAVAVASGPKVVIVVGATEGTTASYRADADTIATEALKYTPNVIKLYSPNATYAMVKAAAQGASIFVYLGHGYGYPSPYRPILSPTVHDGMGLNEIGGVDDNDKKYYGESLIASDIRFAKNAVVLLNHLCYSAGSSESARPGTDSQRRQGARRQLRLRLDQGRRTRRDRPVVDERRDLRHQVDLHLEPVDRHDCGTTRPTSRAT